MNIYIGQIYLDDTITWEKIIQEKWNYLIVTVRSRLRKTSRLVGTG